MDRAPGRWGPLGQLGRAGDCLHRRSLHFTVTFDNASGADTGYGPFVDLLFPVNGADGAAGTDTPDGIVFIGATYLGASADRRRVDLPRCRRRDGCVNHPYARDTTGAFVQVCGTAGDTLVVLQLPFGSFTPTQPPAVVVVGATMSNLADVGTPLTIRGARRFPLRLHSARRLVLRPGDPAARPAPTAAAGRAPPSRRS